MNQLKIPLTLTQQVELLESRGLEIKDKAQAKEILARLNYYRVINAYSLGLYADPVHHIYQSGVSLAQIYDIYEFDTKLRHVVFELVEYFELKFRTSISYYLSNQFCATAYARPELYRDENYYHDFMSDFEREKHAQQRSLIVKHHNNNYDGHLPAWAMVEIVSFGTLSKLYKNLLFKYQREIANIYGTHPTPLCSWLNTFVLIRNICAHYGRLYNQNLSARPKIPKGGPQLDNYKIFSAIYLLYGYVDDPLLKLSLYYRLKNAVTQHSFVELDKIGFPHNWEEIIRAEIGLSPEDIAFSSNITDTK